MADPIYGKFTRIPWLHRLGHAMISVGLALMLWRFWPIPLGLAFSVSCVLLPVALECVDIFAGGLLVTPEERKRIKAFYRQRGYKPTADNWRDLLDYQAGWLAFLVVAFLQGGLW